MCPDLISAFLALGVVLRVLLLVWPCSYWGDEWASIQFSSGTVWQTVLTNANDHQPPLYFVLLNLANRFVEYGPWVHRVPSVLMGLGTLWASTLLGRELLDKRTFRLFVWFAAISPTLISLSQLIRNHCAPAFFCTLGTYYFVRMTKQPENRMWRIGFILSALAALYSQHFTWIWLGTLFCFKPSRTFVKVLIGAVPMIGLFIYDIAIYDRVYHFVPWSEWEPIRFVIAWAMVHYRFVWGPGLFQDFIDPSTLFLFVRYLSAISLKPIMAGLWVFVMMGGLWRLSKNIGYRRTLILCIPSVLVFVISSLHFIYMEARYFSFLAVPSLLLFAYGIDRLIRPAPVRWATILMVSFLMLIKSAVLIESHASVRFDGDRWRSLDRIYSQSRPGDTIANTDDERYAFYRRWKKEPPGVRWVERALEADPAVFTGSPRVWVLGTDELGERLMTLGYRKIRSNHLRRWYIALYFKPPAASAEGMK